MFVRILLAMALAVMLFAGSGIDGFSIKSLRSSIYVVPTANEFRQEKNRLAVDGFFPTFYL